MFTGIIKKIGIIKSWDKKKQILTVKSYFPELVLGESISCSGVCLTVTKIKDDIFYCNLSSETILKTNLKFKKIGDKLNLEKSLKVGEDLSGHLVFGHVDGLSKLEKKIMDKDCWILKFSLPKKLSKFLTEKCSISVDGISLTVNNLSRSNFFEVSIVPHTWKNTNLQFSKEGDFFNIEIDMLSRYVFRALNK
tara:strand:- start:712 stop:1290 length:579 start_codon:yes stop_codon:yes gene_type:complete